MIVNPMCLACQINKQEKKIRPFDDDEKKNTCMHELVGIMYQYGQSESAPKLFARTQRVLNHYYGGKLEDYSAVKHRYNQLMLSQEAYFEERIREAEDPLLRCVQYVCAGNYIDFSAVKDVNEEKLRQILEDAADNKLSGAEFEAFRGDLRKAQHLVYLVDNCGEIVLDKIFIKILKEYYPQLNIIVVVRGEEILNDATMEDVTEIGLTEVTRCIENGTDIPGTDLNDINEDTRSCLKQADVIISKGQGNFESLYGCGLKPYYLFLCKCELFLRRFGMKQFSTVFSREDHIRFVL